MDEIINLSASPANDNNRSSTIGGIKSLLCDGCGRAEAAHDGLCHACIALVDTLVDDRRGVGDWRGDNDGR